MQRRTKQAFNTHLIFFFVMLLVFIGLAIFFLSDSEDGDVALSIAGFALAAAPIFVIVISPVIYIFEYEVTYPKKRKTPFFVEGCIVSNRKTSKLLNEHYKKNIKEYWD